MKIKGRRISGGKATGEVLISPEPITFLGGVDPDTGIARERGHPLEGRNVRGKVLVFPKGKGSTVGSYTLFEMKKKNNAPAAIINRSAEQIVAMGAIISGIPMMDQLEKDPLDILKDGQKVTVDADKGYVLLEGYL